MSRLVQTFRKTSGRELLRYIGPGFLISVAYMDPGNWATNIEGGARYGSGLLWVIVAASLVAIFIQIVAAKLGIATGEGVASLSRERFPKPAVIVLWIAAELAMIATDMAEIIGAAIGFGLIFGLPLWAGAVLAGAASFGLLGLREARARGFRTIELTIILLVVIVGGAFAFELFLAKPSAELVLSGLIPHIRDTGALYIAVGILGATVMPHSVYLHSTLVQDRRGWGAVGPDSELWHRKHLHLEAFDTSAALFGAMFVNAAMLIVAAVALQGTGIDTIEEAYVTLSHVFGDYSSLAFGIALIAAGLSSSVVATMAGQVVLDGFLQVRIHVWIRRAVTLVPSIAVVAVGWDPTSVLVASQVALSLELPFVLIPLLWFTRDKALMGPFVNRRMTTGALGFVVAVIVALNVWLLGALSF